MRRDDYLDEILARHEQLWWERKWQAASIAGCVCLILGFLIGKFL
jgi:ElaB/YqjD/DUF883 family membrane-anchored ribosome-binding protein